MLAETFLNEKIGHKMFRSFYALAEKHIEDWKDFSQKKLMLEKLP